MNRLHIPILGHKLRCEPIEQRLVDRLCTLGAKVFACLNNASAEVLLPNSIDFNPSGQGVVFAGNPLRQAQSIAGKDGIGLSEQGWCSSGNLLRRAQEFAS